MVLSTQTMQKGRRSLAAALFAVLAASGASAEEASGLRTSDSRADVSGLPEGEAPWWPSRYGADDQIGSLNELSPERVAAAVRLVRTGERLSLGRIIDENIPVFPGRYWRQTVDLSPHVTNLRRSDAHGKGWGKEEINWITELQVGTQLDSIGHIQWRRKSWPSAASTSFCSSIPKPARGDRPQPSSLRQRCFEAGRCSNRM